MAILQTSEFTNSLVKPTIIGIAGTILSGKDSLSDYLVEQYGFMHASTGDMLRAEKKKIHGDGKKGVLLRNDPFANNLRAERGAGVLVELAYEDFRKTNNTGLVVSGIRTVGEVEKLHELGGKLLFIDSDPKIRYQRGHDRKRDHQDTMTYEEFLAQEASEHEGMDQKDKSVINLPAVKKIADTVIYNDNDLEGFLNTADKAIFTD